MNDEAQKILEEVTRVSFEAGRSRGLFEATQALCPGPTSAYYASTGEEPPRDVDAYITSIKAGLIMRNSGLR